MLRLKRPLRPLSCAAQRLARLSRSVADLDRAESFYRDALGFRSVTRTSTSLGILAPPGMDPCAQEVVMRLGREEIALVRFEVRGRSYPKQPRSDDRWFQHAAIVVSDMDAAYAHLSRQSGWCSISEGGPQQLPPSNANVKAFKFRDPDGHPLELLWFPPKTGRALWHDTKSATPFLGIDHSAIVVTSMRRSLRFYRGLGFQVVETSTNHGAAQTRLDGLEASRVLVTSLRAVLPDGPGLELLEYKPTGRASAVIQVNDAANDWITLTMQSSFGDPQFRHDPDGHRMILTDSALESVFEAS